MNTSLLIMAAGIGSRFGEGIKQLEPVGANGEIIMDYSIHDAIKAGFNKIIFVIRKEIEEDFRHFIGDRIEAVCKKLHVEVAYVFQDLQSVPEGFAVPKERKKPWGTGHAVLAAKDVIRDPFAVINADDYYGKESFVKIHDYLCEPRTASCMVGFVLENTLSENGGVSRGICDVAGGMLSDVIETHNIMRTEKGVGANGQELNPRCLCSMNMWGFATEKEGMPAYLDILDKDFVAFFQNHTEEELKTAEYMLPAHINSQIRKGNMQVTVLDTHEKWFGVTYQQDKEMVVRNLQKKIADGIYTEQLYADLVHVS